MLEFQGFIGILFTSDQLLDRRHIEGLEGERVLGNISIESRLLHQGYHQPVGDLVVERIVTLKMPVVIGVRVSADLSTHGGVGGYFSTFQVIRDISVHRGSHSDLGQEQSHFHVGLRQSQGIGTSPSDGPYARVVKVHVDLDLNTRHQEFAEMKHFQVRSESQCHTTTTQELDST